MDWENPKNFEKYNVKKVTVYSKEIKKNGKIKRDSLLLAKYEYDKSNNIIKGINHHLIVMSHGRDSHLTFYSFENQYFSDSLIIKKETKETPKVSKDKIVNNSFVELYKYDNLNRLIYDKKYSEENEYELSKKDTITHYRSVSYPKTKEYEYDFKNRLIKEYFTRDSSEYHINSYKDKKITSYKSCSSCEEKYLDQEWKYDENNLIEEILYASENNMHSKKKYFYDDINRLIKTIDSTNYFSGSPVLYSSITYKYFTNGNKEKTTINYINSLENKTIEVYDNFGRIISRSKTIPDFNSNELQFFEYENDKITKTMTTDNSADVSKTILTFNKNGLLVEEKWILNNLLTGIEKYYYE